MKLIVTPAAADYIIKQARLKSGDSVAVRGERMAKGQFAITYQPKTPDQAVAHYQQAGHDFFVEFGDEWFFSGKVTTVDYRAGQLVYQSVKETLAEPITQAKGQSTQPQPDASTAASRKYEDYWE
ncbi:MAG TPA: hypothetical protein H9721_04440 [Candidatus Limosilactobacillus intestinipullorum]|nr:hypothetical protein [Candidatus Limosilactobacillus intestinipullorum]